MGFSSNFHSANRLQQNWYQIIGNFYIYEKNVFWVRKTFNFQKKQFKLTKKTTTFNLQKLKLYYRSKFIYEYTN